MKRKVLIIFMTLVLMGITVTGFISLRFSRDEYMDETKDHMIKMAGLIAAEYGQSGHRDPDVFAGEVAGRISMRVSLIKSDGRVIGDSGAAISELDNHGNRPEVMTALSGRIGSETRYSDTLKIDLFYVAYP